MSKNTTVQVTVTYNIDPASVAARYDLTEAHVLNEIRDVNESIKRQIRRYFADGIVTDVRSDTKPHIEDGAAA